MSIKDDIERVRGEIAHLREVIAQNPDAGRYVRALQARVRDYGNLIRQLAEIELARPLPRKPVSTLYLAALKPTDAELAWLGGEADCPYFEGREEKLAAIRAEHWADA